MGLSQFYRAAHVSSHTCSKFTSASTRRSAFAVDSIRRSGHEFVAAPYPEATRLPITADCGGSNGARVRMWKHELQVLADQLAIAVTVCHLPPGTTKWNHIEHCLFACISQNWHHPEPARQGSYKPSGDRAADRERHYDRPDRCLLARR
jgi:hypothetical protein